MMPNTPTTSMCLDSGFPKIVVQAQQILRVHYKVVLGTLPQLHTVHRHRVSDLLPSSLKHQSPPDPTDVAL